MTEVFSNEEQVLNKLEQKPLPDDENQHELNPVEDNVAQTDIRWGRRTIQKLLTNLGFL
ncbi:conserved hypothetical protein [Ricinus communis]|uniref:Uncharacterized protein n=2 Tax=Ricinus communis TaxID=3988 RepID=B9SQ49_RICCO|nr:conserved hypothetical protein [Ricinus communis]